MAEETIDLPVAPVVMNSSWVKLRRNSMSKASSGNIEDVVVPHYRRASIGSCHDFCKYGRKHAFEVKEKHSVVSRIQTSLLSKISEADVYGVKTHVANRRASTGSKRPMKASMAKLKESVNSRPQISNSNEKEMPTKLADNLKLGGSEVLVTKKKTSVVKLKTIHKESNTADLPKIVRRGNSSISTKMVGTSLKPTPKLVGTSSKPASRLVGYPSESTVEPVETSKSIAEQPAEFSFKSTIEPVETSSESIMNPVEIPSISMVEPVECSSKSTPELVETSSKLHVEPLETSMLTLEPTVTSLESIMEPVGTSSIPIEKMVRGSSKSCEECAGASLKPTSEPVEALPKSFHKKEDVSSKSTVKKSGNLSKSTPQNIEALTKLPAKNVEASPKLLTKKVEASPKSTAHKREASSKSTAQKVETSSKSTIKKLETTSKSTAEEKITATKVEPSPKLADKVLMSTRSTAKEVTSSKSTAKVGTSSKLVVKKVVTPPKSTVQNVEASSTSNSMVPISSKSTTLSVKQMKLSEKHVAPLKSNSITLNSISSMNPSEDSNGQSNCKLKMEKRAASLKVAARKLTPPSRDSLPSKSSLYNNGVVSINARKHKSLKIASHLKNQLKTSIYEHEELDNDAVEEKTLYVIRMESGNKSLQSDHDVECTTSEGREDFFSVNLEGELMKDGETLELKDIREPRMAGIVSSEDKASRMSTLNLRKGKLGELQSGITTPRRLKFRKATGFGEIPMVKVEGLRRSFKRRHESGFDRVGTPTGPDKVVLRRQGSQGKRDGHGLFNNVIEETANKLAKIRKSKVKALVGAFETIISLQERQPAVRALG